MINDFTFTVPQQILFGYDSCQKIPYLLNKEKASSVLIVSDRGLESAGAVDHLKNILLAQHKEVSCFLDVEPNPSTEICEAATEKYIASGADCIIALGGGSPMDVAKAVGILSTYGGNITEYEGADTLPGPLNTTIIAIPTTAGTGSETTPFTVITDRSRHYKLTVYSYELIPKYAVLDPHFILSLPPHIAASTGIDALVHAIESYLSKSASPFSDMMAEKAMQLIGAHIRSFVADRSNRDAAEAMMIASTFAGIAFGWARLGNVHAMAHPLGGFFNVPHGVANAVLLPTILEYNMLADTGRYADIYGFLSSTQKDPFEPEYLVDEIKKLLQDLGIPKNLTEVGVTPDKIEEMAADAMKSGNILANPRSSTQADIEMLYRAAL